jgi:hypothetical protein
MLLPATSIGSQLGSVGRWATLVQSSNTQVYVAGIISLFNKTVAATLAVSLVFNLL